MSEPDFQALRQRMLIEIAEQPIYASAQLGKAALDRRVMDAIAKVLPKTQQPPAKAGGLVSYGLKVRIRVG